MRQSAARIASMIQTEVAIMEKRKTYVEQMTSYLNDRIRELNKVKSELEEENRWIEVSNQRIAELAQKEKLVKMQGAAATIRAHLFRRVHARACVCEDVLACLNANKKREGDQAASQGKIIQGIAAQSHAIESEIKKIQVRCERAGGVGIPSPRVHVWPRVHTRAQTSIANVQQGKAAEPAAPGAPAPAGEPAESN